MNGEGCWSTVVCTPDERSALGLTGQSEWLLHCRLTAGHRGNHATDASTRPRVDRRLWLEWNDFDDHAQSLIERNPCSTRSPQGATCLYYEGHGGAHLFAPSNGHAPTAVPGSPPTPNSPPGPPSMNNTQAPGSAPVAPHRPRPEQAPGQHMMPPMPPAARPPQAPAQPAPPQGSGRQTPPPRAPGQTGPMPPPTGPHRVAPPNRPTPPGPPAGPAPQPAHMTADSQRPDTRASSTASPTSAPPTSAQPRPSGSDPRTSFATATAGGRTGSGQLGYRPGRRSTGAEPPADTAVRPTNRHRLPDADGGAPSAGMERPEPAAPRAQPGDRDGTDVAAALREVAAALETLAAALRPSRED